MRYHLGIEITAIIELVGVCRLLSLRRYIGDVKLQGNGFPDSVIFHGVEVVGRKTSPTPSTPLRKKAQYPILYIGIGSIHDNRLCAKPPVKP